MTKSRYLENQVEKIDTHFTELRKQLQAHAHDGHIEDETIVFFDDSYDLFKNFDDFVAAGDGLGTVLSQLNNTNFTGCEEVKEDVGSLQVALYALDEELTPV